MSKENHGTTELMGPITQEEVEALGLNHENLSKGGADESDKE